MQSLRLKSGDGGAALMVKRFALPERFPFDTSDGTFAIANEVKVAVNGIAPAESLKKTSATRAGDRERRSERLARRQKAAKSASSEESATIKSKSAQTAKTQSGAGTDATTRTLSALTNGGSFYIYSATGMLLAEYDRFHSEPVKDYIYIGGRLLAEYKPQESGIYFYTPDQINSTRIVTDGTGTVVYSAALNPYGGIQQTWGENTYDPTLKFSGKERDSESQLDYFGARYYDRAQYRFISVDPKFSRNSNGSNPQLLNLYSFSRGNPISYLDLNGEYPVYFTVVRTGFAPNGGIMGRFTMEAPGGTITGFTLEPRFLGKNLAQLEDSGSAIMAGIYGGYLANVLFKNGLKADTIVLTGDNLGTRTIVCIHNGINIGSTSGCILVGYTQDQVTGDLSGYPRQDLYNLAGMGTPDSIMCLLVGFFELPSACDYVPEITVIIKWDPAFFTAIMLSFVGKVF